MAKKAILNITDIPESGISREAMVGRDIAEMFSGSSLATLRRHWRKGLFPVPKQIGGKLLWRFGDILDWAAALPSVGTGEDR